MKTNLHINIMAIGIIFFLFAEINLTAQINWEKYENNPVISGTNWNNNSAGSPVVLFEEDVFKMWFASSSRIAYAESSDGIDWISNTEPVFPDGSSGAWDEARMPGSVLRVNDTLKMWYSGSSDNFGYEMSIGYAWSLDNITWNILPDPILEKGEPGTWDETGVFQPVVYFDGITYHMWYSGFEGGTSIWNPMLEGYATSTDGINWIKHSDPVLTQGEDGSFYDEWVICTSVLFFDNEFHMWFCGWDGTSGNPFRYWRIGYASSPDGLTWTVENEEEPVVNIGENGTWDDRWACYSSVLRVDDTLRMWYHGRGNNSTIGYAVGDILEVVIKGDCARVPVTISPNPINNNTVISFELIDKTQVELVIYNHHGQEVSTLMDGNFQQGKQSVVLDASALSSGIYFCVLKTSEGTQTKKIIKLN